MQIYILYYLEVDGEYTNAETISAFTSLEKAQEVMKAELEETIGLNEGEKYTTDVGTHECSFKIEHGCKITYYIDEQKLV